jgi:hypothetical protein
MAMTDNIAHDSKEAGPAYNAPKAGRKKMPVPIIEFMAIRSIMRKLRIFSSLCILIL